MMQESKGTQTAERMGVAADGASVVRDGVDAAAVVELANYPMSARQKRTVTIASALVICIAFVAMTIARNNYNIWSPEFIALDAVLAFVGSFIASKTLDLEEPGMRWASKYLTPSNGLAFRIMRMLPMATGRAAIMTAILSVVNATVVPMVFYRETVEHPILSVPVRFLADIPQAVLLCLAVLLVVDWRARKRMASK